MGTIIKLGIAGFLVILILVIYVYAIQKKEGSRTATAASSAAATAGINAPRPPVLPSKPEVVSPPPSDENASLAETPVPAVSENAAAVAPAEPPKPQEYVVQKNDTLSVISEKFYGSRAYYKKIHEFNKDVIGPNADRIREGMKLLIPPLETAQTAPVKPPAPAATAPETVKKSPPAGPDDEYDYYTVESDDTLRGISKKLYGNETMWQTIYSLNNQLIKKPNEIQPGWKLRVPKKK